MLAKSDTKYLGFQNWRSAFCTKAMAYCGLTMNSTVSTPALRQLLTTTLVCAAAEARSVPRVAVRTSWARALDEALDLLHGAAAGVGAGVAEDADALARQQVLAFEVATEVGDDPARLRHQRREQTRGERVVVVRTDGRQRRLVAVDDALIGHREVEDTDDGEDLVVLGQLRRRSAGRRGVEHVDVAIDGLDRTAVEPAGLVHLVDGRLPPALLGSGPGS